MGWNTASFDVFINQFKVCSSVLFPLTFFLVVIFEYESGKIRVQGKDNRRIRTKAENALKLSRIPQKSLLYLASTLNITASYIDKERILLKIWLSHINTFTKHQINVWQVWKRICFFFKPTSIYSMSIDAGNLEAQLASILCRLTER